MRGSELVSKVKVKNAGQKGERGAPSGGLNTSAGNKTKKVINQEGRRLGCSQQMRGLSKQLRGEKKGSDGREGMVAKAKPDKGTLCKSKEAKVLKQAPSQ